MDILKIAALPSPGPHRRASGAKISSSCAGASAFQVEQPRARECSRAAAREGPFMMTATRGFVAFAGRGGAAAAAAAAGVGVCGGAAAGRVALGSRAPAGRARPRGPPEPYCFCLVRALGQRKSRCAF